MREIPLTQGYVARVSDEDYERVAQFKWHVRKCGRWLYAARKASRALPSSHETIYMHRFLCSGDYVDHIDGDTLNNQRINLRGCTNAQNSMNATVNRSNNRSGYKGVSYCSRTRKWATFIVVERKTRFLGRYATAEEAARAYDAAARQHFGEFARINFEGATA